MIRTRSEPASRRLARAIAVAAALLAGALGNARAQTVMLRIQPRVGDTMYTRFEQSVEMVGTRNVHAVDTTMTSRMDIMILSHSLVQASDGHGTTVLAITDSVAMQGHGTGASAPNETIRHAMQGRQAKLHIARDGSAELLGASDDVTPEVEALYSGMPATLPERLVSVRSIVGANRLHSRQPGERFCALRQGAHHVQARLALLERRTSRTSRFAGRSRATALRRSSRSRCAWDRRARSRVT